MNAFDRRQDRRKKLPEDFPVAMRLQELGAEGPALSGRGVDLTMGGIGIVLDDEIDAALHCEIWVLSLTLPDKSGRPVPLDLACLITHGRPREDGHFYGLKFHELSTPARAAERSVLRQFLLSDLRDFWQGHAIMEAPTV